MVINNSEKKINLLAKKQKNRYKQPLKKIKFIYGDSTILNSKQGFLELIQLTYFRRILKKAIGRRRLTRTRYSLFRRKRIFFFLRVNFFLQKKVKNSRMGKGKGEFHRKLIVLRQNSTIFELTGFSVYKLKWITAEFNKKSKLKYRVVLKNFFTSKNWFENRRITNRHFYKKYLYY